MIGRAPMKFGSIDWAATNDRARQLLKELDVHIDVTQALGSYSVAIQQMAAIARALEISSARILILDEPTSSLTTHETATALQRHAQAEERRNGNHLHHSFSGPGV